MRDYYTVLAPVLTVFLVIGSGFAMRRLRVLRREGDRTIFRLVVNLLYPCLILDSIIGNPALRRADVSLSAPLLCVALVLTAVGLGWLLSRATGLKYGVERRTFAATTGINNYGYFAIPVIAALFQPEAVGVCFAYNMGSEICLWTLIAWLIGGGSPSAGWRGILNAPLIAIVSALLLNLLPAREYVPGFVWNTLALLGQCAIPCGLLMVGASFSDFTVNGVGELFRAKRVSATALLVRSLLMPLIIIAAAKFLPLPLMLKQVLVVQAAMPAATFTVVMTQHYGGHTPTALRVVLIGTVAGLVTIPLWIHFGLLWLR
ncbi:MAG: AEC family transporter [Verrucomicrobiales bacterium]|jgi:predicted permease|nr:AEC family transporter [Verrucomicrobiales bacterium]